MLGSNPIRKQELGDGQTLWIEEAFPTIQGEGPWAGHPAVFVRLAGCNLGCFWCDTEFESSTWSPRLVALLERIESLRPANCNLVVITGGEPFRQNIGPLVRSLLDRHLRVQIETNGTLWVELPDHPDLSIVCSPKTGRLNDRLLSRVSAYKYVLAAGETDPADGLPIASTQSAGRPCRLARPQAGAEVYVMPRDDRDPTKNAANLRACVRVSLTHGYVLSLQAHKIAGLR